MQIWSLFEGDLGWLRRWPEGEGSVVGGLGFQGWAMVCGLATGGSEALVGLSEVSFDGFIC